MKKILLILSLILAVSSWAACGTSTMQYTRCGISQLACTYTFAGVGVIGDFTAAPVTGRVYGLQFDYTFTGKYQSTSGNKYGHSFECTYQAANNAYGGTCVLKYCDTQCELDSIQCVNAGNTWGYDGGSTCGGMSCQAPCDTTHNCIEYPFNRCEDVPSDGQIYCDENGCTGLPYSRWWSEYRKECTNECGDHTTQSFTGDTLITFNSTCNDSSHCSDEVKCVDFPSSQTYLLYQVCIVGNEQIGNGAANNSYTNIVGGGSGSCASLGMPSNNIADPMNNTSPVTFPNQDNYDVINDNCLIYGIDCPPNYIDTTDYNDVNNRGPEHCVCEKLDGMSHMSTIICPDGSRTTFFGSCDEWNMPRSSSSMNPPESSSSGSENPPASSGGGNSSGISGEYPDWPEYSKNQRNTNDLLGSMTQTLKQIPGQLLEGVKNLVNGFAYNEGEGEFIFDRADSLVTLDTILDTAGLLHAIFGRIDSNNTILDTLQHSNFSGCPTCTFFAGNPKNDFSGGHIRFKEIKFELGNIHGFNLCRIFSVVVTALASVVSFFIGFSIFKNISQ